MSCAGIGPDIDEETQTMDDMVTVDLVPRTDMQCMWLHSTDATPPTAHSPAVKNWEVLSTSYRMYEQQLYTDASLVVGDQTLHVHRAVLAAASPVFEGMFRHNMQEGG